VTRLPQKELTTIRLHDSILPMKPEHYGSYDNEGFPLDPTERANVLVTENIEDNRVLKMWFRYKSFRNLAEHFSPPPMEYDEQPQTLAEEI